MKTSKRQGPEVFEEWESDRRRTPRGSPANGGSSSREWSRFRREMDQKLKRLDHRIDRLMRKVAAADPGNRDVPGLEALEALRRRGRGLAEELAEKPEHGADWRAWQDSVIADWTGISKEARALSGEEPRADDQSGPKRPTAARLGPEIRLPRFGPKR